MRMKQLLANYRQNKLLYWLILPSLIFILIFNYIPMGGLIIAFQDYSFTRGIWGSEWIGFENFTDFFSGMYFGRTLGNTLALSGLDLLFNFPDAILLALMLNEVRSTRFKRTIQTVSYMPHFISMVVAAGLIKEFCDFNALLPYVQRPEYTEGYEGFYHLEGVSATVDHATARYIVRDHDAAKFQQKLDLIDAAASMLNQRLGEERVTVEIRQQYRNMAEIVRDYPELIDVAKEAYLACGVEPQVLPIRGGTDGAQLSFRGLPCPNLSTGGYCYHGVNEFVPVSSLVKMTDVLQELVARFA